MTNPLTPKDLARISKHTYRVCPTCIEYVNGRQSVLSPALAGEKSITGETSEQIIDRFMGAVHRRHMAGLSLAVS